MTKRIIQANETPVTTQRHDGRYGNDVSVTAVLLQLLGEIDDLVFTRAKPQFPQSRSYERRDGEHMRSISAALPGSLEA